MSRFEHFKQLKNILMFEAEKEKEIRSDVALKINRNSLKKHEYSGIIQNGKDGGLL